MSEWKEYRFSDFINLNPIVKIPKGIKVSFVEMKDLENGKRFCEPSQKRDLSGGSRFENNDTLFARITPCLENGKICQVRNLDDGIGFGSTEFHVFREKQNISNSDFIYYLSRCPDVRDHAEINLDGTSGRQRVPRQAFDDLILNLPPLPEQKAIASILSSLDDKIDLLHRQNATLEKMAETLFRQWFVEFSENKGEKTYNSELGEIPISIRIDQIKNLSHILESGKRPKGGVGSLTTGVPSIGAESIKGLGNFDYTKTKFVSEQFAGSMSKGFVNGYELLIYKDGGTPGHFIPRYSIFGAGFPFDKMVINEHVFKLDFGSKAYNFFMYYFFQTEITESILVANGAKAAIPGINQEDIRNLWVITPDNSLIESFGEITLSYLEKVLSNCKQIRTLTSLRDTLLPKLMSGEVRVKL
ncbi:MAG: hypothetical protein RL264_2395 [Bacteroidota bacterium]|jgi:type I restriction enzyme S subunit